MTHKEYNGWTNYETWACHLWLTNDKGSDEMIRELVFYTRLDTKAHGHPDKTAIALANSLKELVEEYEVPDLGCSLAADLLGAAMSEINWHEIAESFLEEVGEEVE